MDVVEKKELVKQEDALTVYLESLLGGGQTEKIEEPPPVVQEKQQTGNVEEKNVPEVSMVADSSPVRESTTQWLKQETEIKCLSAVVAGLNILIPADVVDDIQNVTNRLKPSATMPSWIYDLDDEEDEAVQVVNTQKLLFEGLKSQRLKTDRRLYAVLLDDGSWGLACDAIGEVVTVKKHTVSWRGESSKRGWLAGTCQQHEAVVLDVKNIEKALII